MLKPLIVVAFVASLILIVSSTVFGSQATSCTKSEISSSSSSSESTSSDVDSTTGDDEGSANDSENTDNTTYQCNGPNECYKNCTHDCPPETCISIGKVYHCPLQTPENCKPACKCVTGYYRNNDGFCVSKAKCNQSTTEATEPTETTTTSKPELQCGPYETQDDCPVNCPSDYCAKSEEDAKRIASIKCQKPKDPKNCPPPKCKCSFNNRYNASGYCTSVYDCPQFKCTGEHEEYDVCPSPFCSDSCSSATPDGECHIIGRIGIVIECFPTCRCKKNFWRLNGKCEPYEKCPPRNDTITIKSNDTTTTTTPSDDGTTETPSVTTRNETITIKPNDTDGTTETPSTTIVHCCPRGEIKPCPAGTEGKFCTCYRQCRFFLNKPTPDVLKRVCPRVQCPPNPCRCEDIDPDYWFSNSMRACIPSALCKNHL